MNFFTIARIAASMLPIISDVVKSVEELHSDSFTGAEKKALALSVIESCYNATNPAVTFDQIKANIGGLVDVAVGFYNDAGKFVKSAKTLAA